ncbi:MAG: hypothetical protein FWH10_04910 [Oscillospiraceae bacterium]|nr:hypothetical protein [Oscillospiraceae bacterium]
MTLTQKFAALTPEQQEKFKALKDSAALDAFLAENSLTLTDEEKAQAAEYFKTGKLPLPDEELDNVAGGCGFGTTDWYRYAKCSLCKGQLRARFVTGKWEAFCTVCNAIQKTCPRCTTSPMTVVRTSTGIIKSECDLNKCRVEYYQG